MSPKVENYWTDRDEDLVGRTRPTLTYCCRAEVWTRRTALQGTHQSCQGPTVKTKHKFITRQQLAASRHKTKHGIAVKSELGSHASEVERSKSPPLLWTEENKSLPLRVIELEWVRLVSLTLGSDMLARRCLGCTRLWTRGWNKRLTG